MSKSILLAGDKVLEFFYVFIETLVLLSLKKKCLIKQVSLQCQCI